MVQVPGGTNTRYQAPTMRLGRSQFDLSHNHKTTFEAGQLIPYFVTEVLPGDTMTCKLNSFLRIFSPLNQPIMDNIHVGIDFFYVPNRLVWTSWESFLGAHDAAGAQDTDYTVPVVAGTYTVAYPSLGNYMGLPIGLDMTSGPDINALPFRSYRLIYNEWYRDQNLIDSVSVDTGDSSSGVSYVSANGIFKSAKKPDYFTTALPYLQKGDAQQVVLSGSARIATDAPETGIVGVYHPNTDTIRALDTGGAQADVSATQPSASNILYADLGAATTGITINALREAAAVQRLLERDARGGTRITELTRSHWGVDVPDYRVQRPEYLGGGTGYINVSPVAQTSTEGGTENVGKLAGIGTGILRASWAKSFVEHGHVIGILRARGEVSYQQGVDRMWTRQTKFDFPWPELSQLGEQPIYNQELYISNDANDEGVFGYQERYAEWRFKKSIISGKFGSDASGSIDEWHLAEDFSSLPSLNQTFIEDQTPMTRVQAVTTEPDFIIDGRFDLKVARALPVRPTPTLAPARF